MTEESEEFKPMTADDLVRAFPEIDPDDATELARRFDEADTTNEVDEALERVNKAIKGYGVEAVEIDEFVDRYYRHFGLLYVNRGDTTATTILYDTLAGEFLIGDWSGWLEAYEAERAAEIDDGDEAEEEPEEESVEEEEL